MELTTIAFVATLACAPAGRAFAENVATLYSADGLHDGNPSWYGSQFEAFTKATGIKVQSVEGGSGAMAERIAKEQSNPQADVLRWRRVTLLGVRPRIARGQAAHCCIPGPVPWRGRGARRRDA